jgi:hypothetical protein
VPERSAILLAPVTPPGAAVHAWLGRGDRGDARIGPSNLAPPEPPAVEVDRVSEQHRLNQPDPDRPPGGSASRGLLIWNDTAELPSHRSDDTTVPMLEDRWSSAGQRLALPKPRPAPRPRPAGPPGWLMGTVALLLIVGVAWLVLWPLVVRPAVRTVARDALAHGLTESVAGLAVPPRPESGQIAITEADLNGYLREHAAAFAPLGDPGITVTGQRVRLSFTFVMTTNGIAGRPEVRDGRLVLLDPTVDGPVARFLRPEETITLAEEQLALLFTRANLRPTELDLRDALLIVSTEPAKS